jgi:AcrR family transcriptional regulator
LLGLLSIPVAAAYACAEANKVNLTSLKPQDARVKASIEAIEQAFVALLMEEPYDDFNVRSIIERAGVARSTYYEHFRNKDALFVHALHDIYAMLFRNVVGTADLESNCSVLSALWHKRALLRHLGEPAAFVKIVNGFDVYIYERIRRIPLQVPAKALSRQLASAMLHPINAWLRGEFRAEQDELSRLLISIGELLNAQRA